ncbi:hypothetical protein D3C71_1525180 [compost metagenome]
MAKGSRRTTPWAPKAAAVVSEPMVAAMYTPSVQVRASVTSGTVVERRPPKMKASIGTPLASSHWGSSAGLLVAATVKRELGWAALAPVSLAIWGVQSLPCQSIRWSGSLPVSFSMPSHHTSPSSVRATLVKITSLSRLRMQLGLVCMLVPGATPK